MFLDTPLIGGPSLSISLFGQFLVFVYIWLPYMILPIHASLERVPGSLSKLLLTSELDPRSPSAR